MSVAKRLSHPRTFDVLRARQLVREQGLSYDEVARRMGVSNVTIRRSVDLQQKVHQRRYQRRWSRGFVCPQCEGQKSSKGTICRACTDKARITGVRPSELCCCTCKLWKPDDEFGRASREKHRRYRAYECLACKRKYASSPRGILNGETYDAVIERLRQQRAREAAGRLGS